MLMRHEKLYVELHVTLKTFQLLNCVFSPACFSLRSVSLLRFFSDYPCVSVQLVPGYKNPELLQRCLLNSAMHQYQEHILFPRATPSLLRFHVYNPPMIFYVHCLSPESSTNPSNIPQANVGYKLLFHPITVPAIEQYTSL